MASFFKSFQIPFSKVGSGVDNEVRYQPNLLLIMTSSFFTSNLFKHCPSTSKAKPAPYFPAVSNMAIPPGACEINSFTIFNLTSNGGAVYKLPKPLVPNIIGGIL